MEVGKGEKKEGERNKEGEGRRKVGRKGREGRTKEEGRNLCILLPPKIINS